MSNQREYRVMQIQPEERAEGQPTYKVRGYASTFDPYVLYSFEGVDYSERIDPHAFDDADMSDVVFRVDHEGPVYARSSAGTIQLYTDEHGLGHQTDLSRTVNSRNLYDDIAAGNYPQMSFAFTVAEDGDHYEKKTHTRVIDRIAKVFDISAVSFPANPGTELSVSTRSYFDGVIEMERAERLEEEKRQRQLQRMRMKMKMED